MLALLLTIFAYAHANNETMDSLAGQNWTNLTSDEELSSSAPFNVIKERHREVHETANVEFCSEPFYQSLKKLLEFACDDKVDELTNTEAGHFFDDEIKQYQSVVKRRRSAQIILDMIWVNLYQEISDIFPHKFETNNDVDENDTIEEE